MRKISYYEFEKMLNEVREEKNEQYWSLDKIVSNGRYYQGEASFVDGYFSLLVEAENEELIKEFYEFLLSEGFDIKNNNYSSGLRNLMALINGKLDDETKEIEFEDGIYYFDFTPKKDNVETLYEFLNLYEKQIQELVKKYDSELSLSLMQLDDVVEGRYVFTKDDISGAAVVSSKMVVRHLFIAGCMVNQLGRNEKELEELFVEIYVDDQRVVVINDENVDLEENQAILEMIKNGEGVQCIYEFDEEISEEEVSSILQMLNGNRDFC